MSQKSDFNSLKSGPHSTTIGTGYESQYGDLNPYAGATYKKSWWQSFLGALGFRSSADAWQENMSNQAREWDSSYSVKLRDQQYDSPIEQAQRLRAAGINPNLSDAVDSGESASMPQDPSIPTPSTPEMEVGTFANGVMSAFTTALGIVGSVQGVKATALRNNMQQIQNESALFSLATDAVDKTFPSSEEAARFASVDTGEGMQHLHDYASQAKLLGLHLNRRERKKFNDFVDAYAKSAPADAKAFAAWRDRIVNRKEHALQGATNYSEIDDVLVDIADELGKLNEDVQRIQLRQSKEQGNAGIHQAQYMSKYWQDMDPQTAAQAQNSTNKSTIVDNDIHTAVAGAMRRVTESLRKHAEKGGFAGTMSSIMLVSLYTAQTGLLSSLPNIGFNPTFESGVTKNFMKMAAPAVP